MSQRTRHSRLGASRLCCTKAAARRCAGGTSCGSRTSRCRATSLDSAQGRYAGSIAGARGLRTWGRRRRGRWRRRWRLQWTAHNMSAASDTHAAGQTAIALTDCCADMEQYSITHLTDYPQFLDACLTVAFPCTLQQYSATFLVGRRCMAAGRAELTGGGGGGGGGGGDDREFTGVLLLVCPPLLLPCRLPPLGAPLG